MKTTTFTEPQYVKNFNKFKDQLSRKDQLSSENIKIAKKIISSEVKTSGLANSKVTEPELPFAVKEWCQFFLKQ